MFRFSKGSAKPFSFLQIALLTGRINLTRDSIYCSFGEKNPKSWIRLNDSRFGIRNEGAGMGIGDSLRPCRRAALGDGIWDPGTRGRVAQIGGKKLIVVVFGSCLECGSTSFRFLIGSEDHQSTAIRFQFVTAEFAP
jgi:hypothetical protein